MSVALVLESNPYAFPDKVTGEIKKGLTVKLVDMDSPIEHPTRQGYQEVGLSGPESLVAEVVAIPGWYSISCRMRPNRETGKAELQLARLRFLAPLEVPSDES